MEVQGRVLHPGTAKGPTVQLDAPLSFWGGFDPTSGLVIDSAHPQVGVSLAGRVVVMPGSRGSSGTPGALAESIRLGTGPAGLILQKPDINLTAGALVAATLYSQQSGASCPIVLLDDEAFAVVRTWPQVFIAADGRLRLG